jgi:hypothetical protein
MVEPFVDGVVADVLGHDLLHLLNERIVVLQGEQVVEVGEVVLDQVEVVLPHLGDQDLRVVRRDGVLLVAQQFSYSFSPGASP